MNLVVGDSSEIGRLGNIVMPTNLTDIVTIGTGIGEVTASEFTPTWDNTNATDLTYSSGSNSISSDASSSGWTTGIYTNETTKAIPGTYIEYDTDATGLGMFGFRSDISNGDTPTGYTATQTFLSYPHNVSSNPRAYMNGTYSDGTSIGSATLGSTFRIEFINDNGVVKAKFSMNGVEWYRTNVPDLTKTFRGYFVAHSTTTVVDNIAMKISNATTSYTGKIKNIEIFTGVINTREEMKKWIPGSGVLGSSTLVYQSREGKGA
jgi:hypothetical protein